MTVLVTAASKHGATLEIAEAIARVLDEQDASAELVRIDDVQDLGRYDAVVLGSAVYMGRWIEPARKFVERSGPTSPSGRRGSSRAARRATRASKKRRR
jgi:menaquinone-dependent protoporphyrinogen oxidase